MDKAHKLHKLYKLLKIVVRAENLDGKIRLNRFPKISYSIIFPIAQEMDNVTNKILQNSHFYFQENAVEP